MTLSAAPNAITLERENAGSVDATGVEAEAHQRVGAVALELAGAYTDARVDGGTAAPRLTGRRPAETPRLTATSGLDWSAGRLGLHGELRYESKRFDDDLNTLSIAPSVAVNARADWRLAGRASLFVRIDNLAGAAIQTGQTTPGVKTYDAPRAVVVGLSVGL